MTDAAWHLRDLRVRGRLEVADLRLGRGWTAVLGASGAGKSTLLEVLVGFCPPDRGGVERPATTAWAPAAGSLWPHLTAIEHLAAVRPAGREARGGPAELLEGFGLEGVADRRPDRLSDGERDRLRVARALAMGAEALVLDEPFGHVEKERARRCWACLRASAGDSAVVFATHDPRTVLEFADDVVVLEAGRVAWAGPVAELYRRPASAAHGALLGDGNWFEPGEARAWLGVDVQGWVRPEQLELDATENGDAARLLAYRSLGPVARSRLGRADGLERTFYHRPLLPAPSPTDVPALCPGARARLRWLGGLVGALASMVGLASCGEAEGLRLPTERVVRHGIPPLEGRQPAPRAVAPAADGSWLVLDDAGRVLVLDGTGAVLREWRMPETDIGRPEGVLQLADGRIAVADTHYNRVVLFDDQGQEVGRWGEPGTGPGQFGFPVRLCQGDDGSVYVAEYGGNDRVQRFAPDGTWLGAFGGFGREDSEFQRPSGLAFWDGSVFVADALNNRVHRFDPDGAYRGVYVGPDQGLDLPYDITVDGDGTFYLVEYGGGCLTVVRDGRVTGRFGRAGTAAEELRTPWGLGLVGPRTVVVADTGNRRLLEIGLR